MKTPSLNETNPGLLSELIGLETAAPRAWNAEELGAVLRHQLSAPVQFELSQLSKATAGKLATLADAQHLLLKSFSDLFQHPNPPVELLIMVKDFAKASGRHPDSLLPEEVAYVLYYAAIIAARRSCGRRITKLDDPTLRHCIELTLAKPWLDEPTRALFQRGIETLDAS